MSSKIASLRRRILALSKQAGANDFYNVVWKPDIRQAFKQAQEDAEDDADFDEDEEDEGDEDDEDDDGHWGSRIGSYSGTILEKHDYKILSDVPVLEAAARKAAYDDVEDNDKWGPAWARALKRSASGKKTEGWLFYGMASS